MRADQKRLTQILVNILGNALKFTKEGHIAFRIQYAREIALIEIEDTGPGIKPSEYSKIFEPFSRGSAANQVNIGGTGLGLTISKLLTELMGGELNFTSAVGKGTTFQVRLFLSQMRQESEETPKQRVNRVGYHGEKRKILVVDNEQVDRELIKNILAPLGFEVLEAATGQECLDVYQATNPDAILMDLAMPVMDGWEASYIVRKLHQSNIPIAIVSANAFDKNLENAAGITANDFIVKPVNVEELLDWIGDQLSLDWIEGRSPVHVEVPQYAASRTAVEYPEAEIEVLIGLINIGYVKGIQQKLDSIVTQSSRYTEFVELLRNYAKRFQLEEMKRYLEALKTV